MTNSFQPFIKYYPCPSDLQVSTVDGSFFPVVGIGDIKVVTNLISTKKLETKSSYRAYFDEDICMIFDKVKYQRIGFTREQGLYSIRIEIT